MSQTTTPTGPTTGHRDESSVRQEALVADHSIEVERGAAAQNGDAALLRRAGQSSGHT
jgi:hypothetical protein